MFPWSEDKEKDVNERRAGKFPRPFNVTKI